MPDCHSHTSYRLSIFGYPGDPASAANPGLLDQRMAIEWVRDNIAGFGGDPDRIIIFGESAGAQAVDYYSYAWAHDPIVKGFIAESGTAAGLGTLSASAAVASWYNASAALGCGGAQAGAQKVHDCMVSKSVQELVKYLPAAVGGNSAAPFTPAVDDELVFANYTGRKPAAAPMLVGNNDNESGLLRLYAPGVPESAWEYVNNYTFTCPAGQRAEVGRHLDIPTWRYRYFGDFPNLVLTTNPPSGAYHGAEVRTAHFMGPLSSSCVPRH